MNMWWQSKHTQRGEAAAGTPLLLLATPRSAAAGTGLTRSPGP